MMKMLLKPEAIWIMFSLLMLGSSTLNAAGEPRDANKRLAYNGSSMECLVANDFYAVHFTALQPGKQSNEKSEFVKYCQEIPSVGMVYLTMDMLDRDVRTTPIALRVIEESYDETTKKYKEIESLKEQAPHIYKNGTADTHVEITKPGHYALIATFGTDEVVGEDDRLRIPFSVALQSPHKPAQLPKKIAVGLAVVFMLFVAWFVANYFRKNKKITIVNP